MLIGVKEDRTGCGYQGIDWDGDTGDSLAVNPKKQRCDSNLCGIQLAVEVREPGVTTYQKRM